ncbi:hypothetical protein C1645_794789 [Glomus cerebriforme]|uniref:Uncharacterized protein n=1 Tax=Glomus cerebriforme TaxID=658196 RepID=A0A397SA15_9GLOM|nr:hypothetical protein C1645_794789 [Glomus cerebriforme]
METQENVILDMSSVSSIQKETKMDTDKNNTNKKIIEIQESVISFTTSVPSIQNLDMDKNNSNKKIMKTQENVILEESFTSSVSSTQNETKIDIDKNNSNNEIMIQNNPFYNLIKKQAKEFEEFGKRMSLDLQNSFKEYSVQQNGIIKSETDPDETVKIFKKYEEKIDSQTHLIDSLRARIEELETDSIIKDQDIKKIKHEFDDFKKEIKSVLAISTKSVSLTTNENAKDFKLPKLNDQLSNTGTCVHDEKNKSKKSIDDYGKEYSLAQNSVEDITDAESEISYQQYYDHEKENEMESELGPYQQYNKINKVDENYYDDEPYQQQYGENYYDDRFYQQYNENNYKDEENYKVDENYYNYESSTTTSTSYQQNNKKNSPKCSRNVRKIHAKVLEILDNLNNESIKDYTFKPLRAFNINALLAYERSNLFNSLSKIAKRSINISVNDELRDELSGKKKITQPLSVYINRKIVPSLPSGITSYTDFETTFKYQSLSSVKKERIQKVISMEKKNKNKN